MNWRRRNLEMAQTSDITSKRLISLDPEEWVRWATNVLDATDCEILSADFQFLSRESDTLILVNHSSVGKFLTLFEMQTRYSPEMPKRMRVYAALAEAKYDLPVYPVLINILPYYSEIPSSFTNEFLGLHVRQDYRVINLWEISAEQILSQNLTALIPFIPAMAGGKDEDLLLRAQAHLQLDETLRNNQKLGDLQTALSLFGHAFLEDAVASRVFRWRILDMDIIIESPLYQEIMRRGRTRGREEGVEEGRQEGRQEELRNVLTKLLNRKFGVVSEAVHGEIEMLSIEQAESLVEAILDFEKPEDLQNWLAQNLKSH